MSPRSILISSLTVGLLAGVGLVALALYLPPSPLLLALALLLIALTIMGLTGPAWWLILRKVMPKADARELAVMGVRFGLWSGIFVTSLILLRMLGFMDRVLILAILALLIMVEMFLQQNAVRKRPSRKSKR